MSSILNYFHQENSKKEPKQTKAKTFFFCGGSEKSRLECRLKGFELLVRGRIVSFISF